MTLKDPFLEGTFWDKFWRPIRSRALLFTPDETLLRNSTLETVFRLFPKIRNGQSPVGGPKWTKMDLFTPKWTILVHFGLANAKIQFGIRSF